MFAVALIVYEIAIWHFLCCAVYSLFWIQVKGILALTLEAHRSYLHHLLIWPFTAFCEHMLLEGSYVDGCGKVVGFT